MKGRWEVGLFGPRQQSAGLASLSAELTEPNKHTNGRSDGRRNGRAKDGTGGQRHETDLVECWERLWFRLIRELGLDETDAAEVARTRGYGHAE